MLKFYLVKIITPIDTMSAYLLPNTQASYKNNQKKKSLPKEREKCDRLTGHKMATFHHINANNADLRVAIPLN